MYHLNDNKKSINLPAYINIPFFLYQDMRLEKSATLIAAFFYSLFTSGLRITASTDYLCTLAGIHKRQFYKIMNQLEEYQYIRRSGFTNRKKIEWVHCPKSSITVVELDTSALQCSSVEELNTSALEDTKLVHSTTLNLCTPVHTYNKDYIKDYKTTTTVPPVPPEDPSSSSFFSQKQEKTLLDLKLSTDQRSDELFLENCEHHVKTQTNTLNPYQRFAGLRNLLCKLHEAGEHFIARGFAKNAEIKVISNSAPTVEDFESYKSCIKGYEWVGSWMQKQRAG